MRQKRHRPARPSSARVPVEQPSFWFTYAGLKQRHELEAAAFKLMRKRHALLKAAVRNHRGGKTSVEELMSAPIRFAAQAEETLADLQQKLRSVLESLAGTSAAFEVGLHWHMYGALRRSSDFEGYDVYVDGRCVGATSRDDTSTTVRMANDAAAWLMASAEGEGGGGRYNMQHEAELRIRLKDAAALSDSRRESMETASGLVVKHALAVSGLPFLPFVTQSFVRPLFEPLNADDDDSDGGGGSCAGLQQEDDPWADAKALLAQRITRKMWAKFAKHRRVVRGMFERGHFVPQGMTLLATTRCAATPAAIHGMVAVMDKLPELAGSLVLCGASVAEAKAFWEHIRSLSVSQQEHQSTRMRDRLPAHLQVHFLGYHDEAQPVAKDMFEVFGGKAPLFVLTKKDEIAWLGLPLYPLHRDKPCQELLTQCEELLSKFDIDRRFKSNPLNQKLLK